MADAPLAIDGGQPVREHPFPQWPSFAQDERSAVDEVLCSGRVNAWTGEQCRLFEEEFAASVNRRYGVALANGTLALELALLALDIGPGDEVIVTPSTFVASATCVLMRGATPVFVDVDFESQNITAETIAQGLSDRTRAVIVVHLAGRPCEMGPILELARDHGLKVIEDCAQAHGATYKSRPIGSMGHAAAFSFCQDKIITTGGEGGMLVTDDREVWRKAWEYKDHGKSYEAVFERQHPPGFRWLHESLGTNWRMTEMQAAIGRCQLRKLQSWVRRRQAHAAALVKCFSSIPALRVPEPPDHIRHAYYKFTCFVRTEHLAPGWDRDRIMQAVAAEGVPCFSGFCPEVYREKVFDGLSCRPENPLPMAHELGKRSLMFLLHPTLTEQDIQDTCSAVGKVLSKASIKGLAL